MWHQELELGEMSQDGARTAEEQEGGLMRIEHIPEEMNAWGMPDPSFA